jgi:hypothetical protein
MEHKGDIEEHGPLEVFEYVAFRRADGVVYFRDAEGLSAYVTVKEGVPYHCGGSFGEGDTALLGVAAIEKGSYNYVEDIKTDDAIFPRNVSLELAEALAFGKVSTVSELESVSERGAGAGPVSKKAVGGVPAAGVGPAILPAGRPIDSAEYAAEDAVNVLLNVTSLELSGLLTVVEEGPPSGIFVFRRGERLGGYFESGESMYFDDEAVSVIPNGYEFRFYALSDEVLPAYVEAARRTRMVVRMDSAAVNPEEFIAWAVEAGKSCIIATAGRAGSANIIITDGEVVGAVTARSSEINPIIDDALAIFYAVDSEAEIFG